MSSDPIPSLGSDITAASPEMPPPPGTYVPQVVAPAPESTTSEQPASVSDEPDPSLFTSTQYTRYEADGRIHSHGIMGLGILQQLRITEGRIFIGQEGDPDTQWIDDEDGHPTLESRPVLNLPSTMTVAVEVEATIPSLPACRIDFKGPLTGSHDHPGGEVGIGFSLPGTYTITVEPFPYRRATITLEVTP